MHMQNQTVEMFLCFECSQASWPGLYLGVKYFTEELLSFVIKGSLKGLIEILNLSNPEKPLGCSLHTLSTKPNHKVQLKSYPNDV